MLYSSLAEFLSRGRALLIKGPVALIFIEDNVEVSSTLKHHIGLGFRSVVAFAPPEIDIDPELSEQIHHVTYPCGQSQQVQDAVNAVIEASTPACWIYYCFNAEYLFFPFCETRSVGEMLVFHTEERRPAMLTYVIDLYAENLDVALDGVSLTHAMLDRSGYYSTGRPVTNSRGHYERQLNFYGGLRWRFEEYIPTDSRRIDRIGIFRAKPDLTLLPNHLMSDPEYNTYSCPWHHNITAAICSFRTAKALRRNPGSRDVVHNFKWHNSEPFQWTSRQLMDLGFMEPGQWF